MGKFVRYGLAAVCFAASVGCLALWQRSYARVDFLSGPSYVLRSHAVMIESIDGLLDVSIVLISPTAISAGFRGEWQHHSSDTQSRGSRRDGIAWMKKTFGRFYFSTETASAYFPIWYSALIFALAGVGVLRFRRQFTIRWALIVTTIVAALIGIGVVL